MSVQTDPAKAIPAGGGFPLGERYVRPSPELEFARDQPKVFDPHYLAAIEARIRPVWAQYSSVSRDNQLCLLYMNGRWTSGSILSRTIWVCLSTPFPQLVPHPVLQ
jgi:hypothetical protein